MKKQKTQKGNIVENGTHEVKEAENSDVDDSCEGEEWQCENEQIQATENGDSKIPYKRTWAPSVLYRPEKEIYNFAGHEIIIYESLDSYGSMIWPGAVALCKYLETPLGKQQVDLLDKSAIEIGAGTGLLSIVATLLGAKVTATDLPEILGNLRCNLSRNTKWYCRHPAQVAALSWGHDLENTFPRSTHHYDYVLAADVVYHHSYLDELLVTMKHLVQSGTALIWSNKTRYESDLRFVENFKEAFHTTLLAEKDGIRIYKATAREVEGASGQMMQTEEHLQERNQTAKGDKDMCLMEDVITGEKTEALDEDLQDSKQKRNAEKKYENKDVLKSIERTENVKRKTDASDGHETHSEDKDEKHQLDTDELDSQISHKNDGQSETEETFKNKNTEYPTVLQESKEEKWNNTGSKEYFAPKASNEENNDPEECCSEDDDEAEETSRGEEDNSDGTVQQHEEKENLKTSESDDTKTTYKRTWAPTILYRPEKEIYNFAGHEIIIYESLDSYGSMIWPGAVALCAYLETPAGKQQVDLLDKSAIEIGAGTGLLSIVATLLGAKVTATDLPEILGNLRCNLSRNTKWYCRHPAQVAALSWGHDLENTFPRSTHHYDYVLAADVVYHHSYLDELLVTMKHLVQSGTALIWANKIRYESDLRFVENFKEAFHTTLLAEKDEIRIYKATAREVEGASGQMMQTEEHLQERNQTAKGEKNVSPTEDGITEDETETLEDLKHRKQGNNAEDKYDDSQTAKGEKNACPIEAVITGKRTETLYEHFKGSKQEGNAEDTSEDNQTATAEKKVCPLKDGITEKKTGTLDGDLEGSEQENNAEEKSVDKQTARRGENVCPIEDVISVNKMEIFVEEKTVRCLNKDLDGGKLEKTAQEKSEHEKAMSSQENVEELNHRCPIYSDSEKETHHFVGCDITVQYLHSWHGKQCGSATLALCKFLENRRHQVNLKSKSVLELGAGTGIVSIVASLLGAWVTATDRTEVVEILTENFNANTKGRSKYLPQTEVLQWGKNLARSFPPSIYHYDYVLAADVVYSHGYVKELLNTMCHFCQRGTTLIWAHEFERYSDLSFEAQFKNALSTRLLMKVGDVKIYMGMRKGKGIPPLLDHLTDVGTLMADTGKKWD